MPVAVRALPAPARRRSGRPLNASSLGPHPKRPGPGQNLAVVSRTVAGLSLLAPRSAARSSPAGQPRAARPASSPLVSLRSSSRPRLPRSLGQPSSTFAACGLTRRCSGPAVLAGLHCSPGSSPSSVWPAAEHVFVRPHPKRPDLPCPCAASPIRGPSRVSAPRPNGTAGSPTQAPSLLSSTSSGLGAGPFFPRGPRREAADVDFSQIVKLLRTCS